ncbi:hypothetical protein CTheo_5396 [Ceratobasidium theobromae]|uniref:glutathione transferase n=1 Tax=Ceratobasidium theobromae TaxID=1582974 RepID=A0A5N5QHC6_9AGAM|nr:hypothetical protein CTheo_5396 [Ceratobasidium theobromae]
MTVTIYGSATSTCTKRVLVTCHEIGVEYKVVPVDLMKLEHKDPVWIETMNPFGAVPVLVDADGTQIYESRAIARYLVAKYSPNSSLLPSPTDPKAYGLFEQAESIEYSSFDPPAIAIYEEQIWAWIKKRDVNAELIEKYRNTLLDRLKGYERILSKQKYLAGDVGFGPFARTYDS